MGTFTISLKENKDYKYNYNNKRGKTVLTSPGFKTKEECLEAIELLKHNIDMILLPKFKSGSGKFFFKIVLNENVLCVSRKFTTLLRIEKAILDIQKYLIDSEILDFTEYIFPEINFDSET